MNFHCSCCLVSCRLFSCGPNRRSVPTGRMVCATSETVVGTPNRLFGPVWTFLYLTIAVSGWLVWREAGFAGAVLPLAIYALQLVLNAAWTPLFFGLHRADLGFFDIVLLWLSIIATISLFYPIHLGAALLLLPYLAWVTFAAALNFAIWRLNPSAAARG